MAKKYDDKLNSTNLGSLAELFNARKKYTRKDVIDILYKELGYKPIGPYLYDDIATEESTAKITILLQYRTNIYKACINYVETYIKWLHIYCATIMGEGGGGGGPIAARNVAVTSISQIKTLLYTYMLHQQGETESENGITTLAQYCDNKTNISNLINLEESTSNEAGNQNIMYYITLLSGVHNSKSSNTSPKKNFCIITSYFLNNLTILLTHAGNNSLHTNQFTSIGIISIDKSTKIQNKTISGVPASLRRYGTFIIENILNKIF
jgi:hypothetical protein